MVIPWIGFPLSKLLDKVEPTSQARYVAFQTLYDPKRMPNQNTSVLDWPYVEGLRLDEAMHPLTILAARFLRTILSRESSAGASLHPAANLQRTANRARWCFDSAGASDRAAFEKPRISPSRADRPALTRHSREIRPTELPSTNPQHSDGDRCAPPE